MHISMLSPTPPSTGMGGALPRDLIQNFVPRVGHLSSMYFHGQYTKSNPLSSSPQNVGMSGEFDCQFQPQGGEIDYWLGQIPTISPPCPYLGG